MRQAVSLGFLSGVNLLITIITQWQVLTVLGPGSDTDAFFASTTVPQLVLSVITGSLVHVLVPLLSGENQERLNKDAWTIILLVGIIFSAIAVALYALAPIWVPFTVPGFSLGTKQLAINLSRIQLFVMLFTALSGVQLAVYHALQRFIWAETTPLLGNVLALVIIIWGLPRYGILLVAWVSVIRSLLQIVLLLPGMAPFQLPDWKRPVLTDLWRLIKPLLAGTIYYKTGPIVDRFLASLAPPGGLSLLYFGGRIFDAGNQIINKAIAAPMVPLLANHAKQGSWLQFRGVYRKRLLLMVSLTALGSIIIVIFGRFLLNILIGYRTVSAGNVLTLWWILISLTGQFIGGAMGLILSTSFYAKGNTVTPTRVGIIGFTLGIVLKILGFLYFDLIGIAVGTSVYYMINALAMWFLLERELRNAVSITS